MNRIKAWDFRVGWQDGILRCLCFLVAKEILTEGNKENKGESKCIVTFARRLFILSQIFWVCPFIRTVMVQ